MVMLEVVTDGPSSPQPPQQQFSSTRKVTRYPVMVFGALGITFLVMILATGFFVYLQASIEAVTDEQHRAEQEVRELRELVLKLGKENEGLRRAVEGSEAGSAIVAGDGEDDAPTPPGASSNANAKGRSLVALDRQVRELAASVNSAKGTAGDAKEQVASLHDSVTALQRGLLELSEADVITGYRRLEASLTELRKMIGVNPDQGRQPAVYKPPVEQDQSKYEQLVRDNRQQQLVQEQQLLAQQANVARADRSRTQEETIDDPYRKLPAEERAEKRRVDVKAEFVSSWKAYKRYAWGHDELTPNSKSYADWGGARSNGLGLQIIDALSTLHIMGLDDEFKHAVDYVTSHIDFDQDVAVSAFEMSIRVVGGLLSAYELDGESDPRLVDTARRVMDKLLVAFNTSTGIPHQSVNLRTRRHWNPEWSGGASVLSEIGSVQLEMRTLSYHTKDPVYDMKATHVMQILKARCPDDMLCGTMIDTHTAQFIDDHITLGALGDSFYEYLLKQFLLTGKSEFQYRKLALTALEGIQNRLLRYSEPSRQAYVAEFQGGVIDHKMDHLACFSGGLFALAAMTIPDSHLAKSHRRAAEKVTATCYAMYTHQVTGIAPEMVEFPGGRDFQDGTGYYLLRPETTESIFLMWRLTKEEKYRDWQWDIFQHIRKHCRTESGGYAGIKQVMVLPPEQDDQMQSFWLAETLKYIYLTFSEDSALDLSEWVLNTEAHPLKIRKRDPLEVWREYEEEHGGNAAWTPPTVSGVTEVQTQRMHQRRASEGERRIVAPEDPLGTDELPPDELQAEQRAQERQNRDEQRRRRKIEALTQKVSQREAANGPKNNNDE